MRMKDKKVALFPARRGESNGELSCAADHPAGSAQIGTITAVNADGVAMVDYPGTDRGPTPARLAVAATAQQIQAAIASRQPAVLVFENGDRTQPIIVGLIESPASVPAVSNASSSESPIIEADVDGKRVRVTAQDEIVLQCGAASVTLRRNGRVVIRGTYVETYSDGTNRIKGGQVQIN